MPHPFMRWPWVSRGRLDDASEQIASLRGQVEKLTDALTRMSRAEKGLPEVPRQPKEPMKAPPKEFHEYVNGFASESVRREIRTVGYKRAANGESWEHILAAVKQENDR